MNQNRVQLLAAFILGALLPSFLFRMMQFRNPEHLPAPEETVTTQEITVPEPLPGIPVLTDDGTIRQMDLEEYVTCVVLAEMYASFEDAALQAQAVAARTYALKRHAEGTRHEMGAVCTDSGCCQAYIDPERYIRERGTQADVDKVARCVRDTAGFVLFWQGSYAECTYFSCSGGRTEDALAVWGSDVPYLQSVSSPGEEGASAYTKSVYFSREELMDRLDRELSGAPADWMGSVTYTEGGGVATVVFAGKSYTGVALRKALGLSSTAFTMVPDDYGVTFHTKGKGHRVGMSQHGAQAMAMRGNDWKQILAHYYPGTEIDKTDAVG